MIAIPTRKAVSAALALLLANSALANELDMAKLGAPPTDSWPTFHGDYSGRRYSTLAEIDEKNVGQLQLAWSSKFDDIGQMRGAPVPVIKGTPLLVNGVLYATLPDLVFAIDARTGKRLWTYKWVDKGGHLVGNRGLGMYKNWLYFMGPDNWVICLDSATGKERWRKEIADARKQYFSTSAPIVAGDHVLVGVGGDAMDIRGFLASLDPETGEEQWRFYVTPGKGEPGIETWPDVESAAHGGGGTWLPGTYDAELKTLYWGTGNANPVYAGQGRMGDNLYTASLVALDVETGKLKWHFQAMPHDTHDYDGTNTPIIFDSKINGQPRKLVSYAARSGWFVTLDRVTGKPIVSQPYMDPLKWVKGRNPKTLEPISDRDNDPKTTGSIGNANPTNWYNPAYSDQTGLFYLNTVRGMSIYFLYDTSPKPAGYAGGGGGSVGDTTRELLAIDPLTGKIAWRHPYPNLNAPGSTVGPGLMATAGNLLFTGDDQRNIIVYRAKDGKILWRYKATANQSNGPTSYMLDGKQFVLLAAGDTLYAFALPGAATTSR